MGIDILNLTEGKKKKMEKKRVSQKPYLFVYFLIESEWNYIFAIASVYIYRKQAQ